MSETTIELRDGETALFGYGSLMSVASVERTLGRRYSGPFVMAGVLGWRRGWDIAMPNQTYSARDGDAAYRPQHILYLNVRPDAGTLLNGVVFVVNKEELSGFDCREWSYSRHTVNDQLQGVRVVGGRVDMYVAKPEYVLRDVRSPRIAAIRASYLRILETGLADLGSAHRAGYLASSDPVPEQLVIDDYLDG